MAVGLSPEQEQRIECMIPVVAGVMIKAFDVGLELQRSAFDTELKREMQVTLGSMHEATTSMVADAEKVQQDAHEKMTEYVNLNHREIVQINKEPTTL